MNRIIAERRSYGTNSSTHAHDFAQLIMPLSGQMSLETRSGNQSIDESSLFYLPPDCLHTFYAKSRNEFLVIDIPGFILENRSSGHDEGVRLTMNEKWKAIRFLLLDDMKSSSFGNLVYSLYRYFSGMLTNNTIPKSLIFIHENYNLDIDLAALASIEGYNASYYCEWFKNRYGMTPFEYIQSARLEKAKELLETTDMPIAEIAGFVGYKQQSSLNRAFKSREKTTPAGYRHITRISAKKS